MIILLLDNMLTSKFDNKPIRSKINHNRVK